MEKRQAQEYIKEILNSGFDQEQFSNFAKNLLNEFEPRDNSYSGNLIPEAFRDHISHYRRIGKYTDPEGEPMDILIVQTKTVSKLERTRTALRNFVVRHLKSFDKYYALVAFYSKEDNGEDWRLSLVKIDIEQEQDKKGKIKTKEELVPAKRFSYLVGVHENSHTAQKQLFPLLTNDHSNPLVIKEKDGDGSVEGAFSIEKVTDEFFEQYKGLFQDIIGNEKLNDSIQEAGLEPNRFVKKLLGQIVFLYFLQKKGWLGVPKDQKMGTGSKRFLQDRFDSILENGGDYFNDFLRHLFYRALARENNDEGVKYYFKQLGCKIPFLNGGLFEAEYDWEQTIFPISNELFRNDKKDPKTKDKGTGILDVFDRYNFTIKEDEPLEKEVAVDPEMLGKVFENMLEITERKSKGAFYTPREIVHYMCQESLIHYLDNTVNDYVESYQKLGSDQSNLFGGATDKKGNLNFEIEHKGTVRVPKKDIEELIRNGHQVLEHEFIATNKGGGSESYKHKLPEPIRIHAKSLDDALADIKICDPAIGSGAFPVGMLHEIVNARLVLNSFIQDKAATPYKLKRHAIRESIYGADIDESAIDIARLRLWLSMIVDEEDYDSIEALPNLDYKIVAGNSLVGFPEDWKSPAFDKIEKLKNEFFNEKDSNKKRELKKKIDAEINKRLESSKRVFGYKVDFDFKLFFSEVWHQKKGFDIVTGNPPYVSISKSEEKDLLKKVKYDTYVATGDLYTLFYEQGARILKPKGNLCFITSNKWINASYGEKTREYFTTKVNPLVLIDFGKIRIFPSATVFVNILLFERFRYNDNLNGVTVQGNSFPNESIAKYFSENRMELDDLSSEIWLIGTKKTSNVNKKIEEKGVLLKNWDGIEFYRGITSGFNEAFHLNKKEAEQLIKKNPTNSRIIKPLLRGKDIKRWVYKENELFIINSHNGVKEKEIPRIELKKKYPDIYAYLLQFFDENSPKAIKRKDGSYQTLKDRADQGDHWTNLRNCAFIEEFEKQKIIWLEISDKANYALDSSGHFLTNSAYFISGENLKYLISVLNSSVADYYFFQITAKIAGGRKRYTKQYVEQIPIPKIEMEKQKPYETLVDFVIESKRLSSDLIFKFYEQLLDSIVFELYFEEEINNSNKGFLSELKSLQVLDENMTDEEKLSIIQSEFERLYDPNHPVRNNIETLDSVEEVRIIKEALK